MNDIFSQRKSINNKTRVPVWFMRQAGRYHQHYQNIKKNSDFMSMCKSPELACQVTLGPIEDFHFDAAILFSDLLFPLENLGLGLSYHSGPPTLERYIDSQESIEQLKMLKPSTEFYSFQKEACSLLKQSLPKDVTLLGFVGAPFTLYTYAAEGAHKGNLVSSKKGLYDGRFDAFMQKLLPDVISEMLIQAEGGAQAICLFDTAAGELSSFDYQRYITPYILKMVDAFKNSYPEKKIIYYSKFTHPHYLEPLFESRIDVFGVDWRHDIAHTQKLLPRDKYIQGNIDPIWLHLPWENLKANLEEYKEHLIKNNFDFSRHIFGLGHGVTIETPEENVRKTVQWVHENLTY